MLFKLFLYYYNVYNDILFMQNPVIFYFICNFQTEFWTANAMLISVACCNCTLQYLYRYLNLKCHSKATQNSYFVNFRVSQCPNIQPNQPKDIRRKSWRSTLLLPSASKYIKFFWIVIYTTLTLLLTIVRYYLLTVSHNCFLKSHSSHTILLLVSNN